MSLIQVIFIFLAGFMLLWFVAPILIWRILNVGNILGIAGCVAVILSSVFWKSISQLVSSFWASIGGKICLSVVGFAFAIGLIFAGTMSFLMIKSACKAPSGDATAVVLGCRVYGTKPSLMLNQRMDKAIEYLNENPEAKAVLSGGQGEGEDISEAQAMFTYMTKKGIDQSRLFMEDKSTNTDQNITFSQNVIKDNNLSENIAIVSQEFHLYRANVIAKKNKVVSTSLPAHTNIILLPTYWVREILALAEETVLK